MEHLNDYDFVERTQKILDQYQSLNLPENENYDVTLFINACVGLLFVAHEQNILPMGEILQFGLAAALISDNSIADGETELQAVCRHIRNSIAHNRFRTLGRPISTLVFDDQHNGNSTFHMEVSLNEFKAFVMNISNFFMSGKI